MALQTYLGPSSATPRAAELRPSQLAPNGQPSPEQFGLLACELVRELARHDRQFRQRLRDEGLDIEEFERGEPCVRTRPK